MKTLLNLSGGIDSVYVAYKWLLDNKNETLLIHHCSLRTHENRWENEDRAVKNVLEWFQQNGLTNFEYIETVLDVKSFRPSLWDSSLLATMTAFILRAYPSIKIMLSNTPKDEFIRLGGNGMLARNQRASVIRSSITQQQIKVIPMLETMMKSQIIKDMPQDLFKLCWYCRTPKGDDVCGECHTCLQVLPHIKQPIKEIKDEINNEPSQPRSRGRKRKESEDNI